MADIVSPKKRSQMMSAIRSRDTKPELLIRKELHARGYRYRLHDKRLPGKPDLVLPKYKAIILVHGCFWHGHNCHLFRWPSSRIDFWKKKIGGNVARNRKDVAELLGQGWRILTVWECALKGKSKVPVEQVIESIEFWLSKGSVLSEIEGYDAD